MYQVEVEIVEQEKIWNEVRTYVENEALKEQAHIVEENLFRRLLTLGRSLLQEVFARHNNGELDRSVENSKGHEIPFHSFKQKEYLSIFGSLYISRAYYWRKGGQGVYPLDKKVNLPQHKYSYLLEKWILRGVADKPYEEAIQSISDIFQLSLNKERQQKMACEVTKDFTDYYEDKEIPGPKTEGTILVGTADCKGVPMVPAERSTPKNTGKQKKARRSKGDKKKGLRRDAVVTADYSFSPEPRTAQEMLESLMKLKSPKDYDEAKKERLERIARGEPEPRKPQNKHVAASLNGKADAFKDLFDRLAQRDPTESKPIYLQIDGEPALEKKLLQELYNRGWEDRLEGVCLDIIHVTEYVWDAATVLHGEKGPGREPWVQKQLLALLEGRVGRVIGGLKQIITKRGDKLSKSKKEKLNRVITYFSNHRHMMKYDIFLSKGFPIATGIIEGACGSLVKDRADGSGMKWTHKGVQAVLNLRAAKQNGDWGDYWEYHIDSEYERLYGCLAEAAA